MYISELIEKPEKIKSEHGDLRVGVSESHEYWGSLETEVSEQNIQLKEYSSFNGPKKSDTGKAVIISYQSHK